MANDLEKLKNFLLNCCKDGAALAFSGGVDSTLLLAVLSICRREKGFPLLAVTAESPLQSRREIEDIRACAAFYNVQLELVHCAVLEIPEIKNNSPERCYHCKRFIFENMIRKAAEYGIGTMIEGTQFDDLKSYRPGMKALKELGVISPLAETGIGKQSIRSLAAGLGVRNAFKPSVPCLATRFEYGSVLEEEKILNTGLGEEFLRSLLPADADLRLRVHGDLARIEVAPENMELISSHRELIVEKLRELGFFRITLDLGGFCSGGADLRTARQ